MKFEDLVRHYLLEVTGDEEHLTFETIDNAGIKAKYVMQHDQDYCEHVRIIDGLDEVLELRGMVALATETVDEDAPVEESGTWTFYNIFAGKGNANLRWLGESNGYYSEGVSFKRVQ